VVEQLRVGTDEVHGTDDRRADDDVALENALKFSASHEEKIAAATF
jgi:hypothetical protein